eukprot:7712990-Pyramimonas_sp.AAC.1
MIHNALERFAKERRATVRGFTYAASLLRVRPLAGERPRGGVETCGGGASGDRARGIVSASR